MTTRKAAKAVVQGIAKKYGYLDEQMMHEIGQWKPEYKRAIEEASLAKDEIAGHSIKTLAKNIYGSGARFVFELLQNADDNQYTRAKANGSLPFFSFEVHKDHIIVECNEDGFTTNNLQAICTVGESTKSGSQGYIGAKGIGFKSVFIAAWKVEIQSGHFTFSFNHEKGGSGLGMVLPIWNESGEELSGPLTRMTLHLHKDGDEGEQQNLRQTIIDQLADLQETSLLFLQNIKSIKVTIRDDDENILSAKSFRAQSNEAHLYCLDVQEKSEEEEVIQNKSYYHITTYRAQGVPKSDNRDLTDDDASKQASSKTNIILAFPLSATSDPVIQNQHIFAFLPVRESSFKFLIQSDFDTSANRQDILSTSRRNIYLRDQIAHAFVQAILEFCEHDTLCYTWPEYLPQNGSNLGAFWSALESKLETLVKVTPCLRSRHKAYLREPMAIVRLAGDAGDENYEPLLDDTSLDPFISNRYSHEVTEKLMAYGLGNTTMSLFLDLLERDLAILDSRMRNASTREVWHTRTASLLSKHFQDYQSRLEALAILPLRGGQWVKAANNKVYFPYTDGILIPDVVGMNVLTLAACESHGRKPLFRKLGVIEASRSAVRSSILDCYQFMLTQPTTAAASESHLRYLFLTHAARQRNETMRNIVVFVANSSDRLVPRSTPIYLPTDHPLAPERLLTSPCGQIMFDANYIHPKYLDNPPLWSAENHPTWKRWLVNVLKIRERLSMISEDGTTLSKEWHFVYKHHPKKALHLLEYLWKFESAHIKMDDDLQNEILGLRANELCTVDIAKDFDFREVWLPFPNLVKHVEKYMGSRRLFPFLDLGESCTTTELSGKWMFLVTELRVRVEDDFFFLLTILSWIRDSSHLDVTIDFTTLLNIYLAIEGRYSSATDQAIAKKCIRENFQEKSIILVSDAGPAHYKWLTLDQCLWQAPASMGSRFPLKHCYESRAEDYQMNVLSNFFERTLGLSSASYHDLIDELQYRRNAPSDDWEFDDIRNIYNYLDDMKLSRSDKETLRSAFARAPLIYRETDGSPGWYTSADCLWASTTDIRGKVTINDHYEDFEDFFTEIIGVKRLTLQMLIDQLVDPDLLASVEEVKGMIWSLNALIHAEGTFRQDPERFLQARIFPVTYPHGSTELVSAKVEFAIADRDSLTALFKNRIKLLDFNLEDLRRLRPFLDWTGLTSRYLSTSIREITSVSQGRERPIRTKKRDLKRKAYGLLRIAATFDSPRYRAGAEAFYDLLRGIETIETDEISTVLQIHQDGATVEARRDIASFHIRESNGEVKVYVPANRREQELCFSSPLPKRLADWLMRNPATQISHGVDSDAVLALSSLLAFDSSVIDQLLENQGIIQVPLANVDEHGEESELDTESETDVNEGSNPTRLADSTSTAIQNGHPDQTAGSLHDYGVFQETATSRLEVRRFRSEISVYSERTTTVGDLKYVALLQRVTRAARQAAFPSKGAFNMNILRSALVTNPISYDGIDHVRGLNSSSQLEHNLKIGAAGELYVFELLSRTTPTLRGWGRDNWQSTIRRWVKGHPEYHDMEPWYGQETSDFTYNDVHGDFTNLLIEGGHLSRSDWAEARPRYFLEVKTTMGPSHAPFFMSKNQYRLMQDKHQARDRAEVYVILRVHELDSDNIGMNVYLDPEQLRQDEDLEFTAEGWSIVPGRRS